MCGTASELHTAFLLSGGLEISLLTESMCEIELLPELGCLRRRLSLGVWAWERGAQGCVRGVNVCGRVGWKPERTPVRVSGRTGSCVSFVGA